MDLTRLEYFLLVADHGSFSRASSVIGIAQPALGRQVQRLESECGVRLFYRHGRGVTLTPEGRLYAERVRPLLQQLAQASEGLGSAQQPVTGSITLGLTPTMMVLLGLPLIQAVRDAAPGVKLNFLTGYSGYVHEWLSDGRLDIAILHEARRSQHIAVDPLLDARLFLVSSAGRSPKTGRARLRSFPVRSLAGVPLALPSQTHGLRRVLDAAAAKQGIRLDVAYELDTLSLMKEVTVAGIAHTVLAMPAVMREVVAGQLEAIPLCTPDLSTRLSIATSLNRPLTRAGRLVIDRLRPALQQAIKAAPVALHLRGLP